MAKLVKTRKGPLDFIQERVVENAVFAFRQPPPLWRHIVVTIVIVVITVVVSMATDCLGIVLELNGVINAAPLAYIFPAVAVMKLKNERILSMSNIPMILTATFGVLVAVIGFIMAIIEMAQGVKCSHGAELFYCEKPESPIGNATYMSDRKLMHSIRTTSVPGS